MAKPEPARSLTCREFIGFLDEFRAGTLPPARRACFEEHLRVCPQCREYLRSYERALELGWWVCLEQEPLPADVPRALVAAILAARAA